MNDEDARLEPPLARASMSRDASTRLNPDALAYELSNPDTRFVALAGDEMLASSALNTAAASKPSVGALAMLTSDEASALFGDETVRSNPLFLGRVDHGGAVFAVMVDEAVTSSSKLLLEQSYRWLDIRTHIAELRDVEVGIFTTALALAKWHNSAGFSPATGNITLPEQGGWMRRDSHSGREIYPRTDPAVIVLVTDETDRVLLGSNLMWNENRYSLLAGFVEAGESLEAAVHREIEEEAGIRVTNLRYVTSQPWPFPQSLMLGFTAKLAHDQNSDEIVPDPSELAALRWFTRAELLDPASTVTLPGDASIARYMIDGWLAQREGFVSE
jgi:NAD+ diphosphatase